MKNNFSLVAGTVFEPVTSGMDRATPDLDRSGWTNVELLVWSRTSLACVAPLY